jgi:iron complex transport system substrate-binding protein
VVAGLPRPRVLAVEWLDPPFVPGHWIPEMIERAGGVCVAGRAGERSVQVSWQQLERLDPDVLVVMPCGYGLAASLEDADRFQAQLERVAPRAVAQGKTFAVDGSAYFNRSGPRYITGIEILAGLLHPDACAPPDARTAVVWPVTAP